jgi:addiction module HigA family antidote
MAMPTKSKSQTTTKSKRRFSPVHPGEILAKEFLERLGLTQYRLAERIDVPRRRINQIVLGQRSISADTGLRLARFFGTSDRFWLNLQATYDLEIERDRIGEELARIEAFRRAS